MLALTATVATVTSGCDTAEPLRLPGLPDPAEEPDRDRVLAAARAEQAALALAERVLRRHRQAAGLREPLDRTVTTHRAHVELLTKALEGEELEERRSPGADPVPADAAQAVAALVRRERALSQELASIAVRSRSGALARVVASMSAAAAQQAALLLPLSVRDQGQPS
jgi:hypothetical protein